MEMPNLKNVNLDVANFAMECVNNAIKDKNIDIGKYKTLVKKTSTLIQKNGFISTVVFILSKSNAEKPKKEIEIKKKQHNNEILYDMVKWNCKNDKIKSLIDYEKYKRDIDNVDAKYSINVAMNYIQEVTKLNQSQYRLITKEMMILFNWCKRFADGMIEGEE